MTQHNSSDVGTHQDKSAGLTRREFLRSAAVAGGTMAFPHVVRASALGLGGATPPSERIVVGGIGIGGRGQHVLSWMMRETDVQFVAVCDVRRERREAINNVVDAKYGNKDCATYRDLREFLSERKDIDAVLIATGDRWHALASVLAMKAGKDVFCEKPGTMTIAEGQALVETARQTGRVFQTGTQRRSEANFIFATQLARTGKLGKLHTVKAHIWQGSARTRRDALPAEPEPPKEEVDWDLWLGPVPWRAYNSAYVKGGWRGFYDLHTGNIGEWGSHTINQCAMAIDADNTSAIEYEYPNNDTGEGLVAKFANGVKLVLTREGWRGSCGVRFEGEEGWVSVADGYQKPDVSAPALLNDFQKVVDDYMAATQRPLNHVRDFFNCVKSRKPPVANAEVAHRSMTTSHCANICIWLGRNLKWDPQKEEFQADAEANALRSRALRQPWRM